MNLAAKPHGRLKTTKEYAEKHLIKEQSLRKHYSQRGSYYGVVPHKFPNGRLGWPDDESCD